MIPQEEVRKIQTILVLGNGLSAFETAAALVALDYEVILVNPERGIPEVPPFSLIEPGLANRLQRIKTDLETSPRFKLLTGTTLQAIQGFAGDFQVHLRGPISLFPSTEIEGPDRIREKEWKEAVGAIVLAPELVAQGNFSGYRLVPSEQIVALEEVAGRIMQGRAASLDPETYIAFLIGLNREGNTAEMNQALHLALEIRTTCQSQVYVFCRNVKVAEEGMERLYQTCRDKGVIFFKFDQQGPEIVRSGDQFSLHFIDPVLGQPLELTPDLLVIDSTLQLPQDILGVARSAEVGVDLSGFLQPANVHLLPQGSKRAGIFIAGSGKGPALPRTCIEEAKATALSVHHFFAGSVSEQMAREVTVDKGLCTICLTCLRFCPHQAIGWTHRVFIHPLACQRCGICASECPMDAIQISGYADQEVEGQLTAIQKRWEEMNPGLPRVVVFSCQRSAGVAWEEAESSTLKAQSTIGFISLPCAGKLDPDYVLKALAMGADGVLVLACPEENCKSLHGNTYAQGRILEARTYIKEAGLDPDRIRFDQLSSNKIWYLKESIERFMADLETIGNPQPKSENPE